MTDQSTCHKLSCGTTLFISYNRSLRHVRWIKAVCCTGPLQVLTKCCRHDKSLTTSMPSLVSMHC
jgi:hypothetical protein